MKISGHLLKKQLNAICHGQCYQKRMARAYNKKGEPRLFEEGNKVLKRLLLVQEEAKGKFVPNWRALLLSKGIAWWSTRTHRSGIDKFFLNRSIRICVRNSLSDK